MNLANDWSNLVASVDARAGLLIVSALLVAIGTRRRARNVRTGKKRPKENRNWQNSFGRVAKITSLAMAGLLLFVVLSLILQGTRLELVPLLGFIGALLVCEILVLLIAAAISYWTRDET